jgi:hypothetical protein
VSTFSLPLVSLQSNSSTGIFGFVIDSQQDPVDLQDSLASASCPTITITLKQSNQ